MLELFDQLDMLKENLDHLPVFQELTTSLDRIKKNQELVDKIKKYNLSKNEQERLEIYQYPEIQQYKEVETEINLFIFSMNQKLKEIKEEGDCGHACH